MKTRPSRLTLLAGSVLLISFAFGQRLMAAPLSKAPDTAWLETHTAELTSPPASPNTPTDVGQNAAILAAQLLLTVNETVIHIPFVTK